jgi:hypothetical protein
MGDGRISMIWTPERDAVVIAGYLRDGPKAVAELLGMTKNAVIGRANRLGLQDKARSPIKPGIAKQQRVRLAVATRIAAEGIAPRSCRWIESNDRPYPDDPFCGAPVQPGTSWCPEHHERVFTKARVALEPPSVNVRTGRMYR